MFSFFKVKKLNVRKIVPLAILIKITLCREEQHLAILTTTMILCFFITAVPPSLTPILYTDRRPLDLGYQTFRAYSVIVELSNYAIYIFIYLVCSTEFRRELLRILQVSSYNRLRHFWFENPFVNPQWANCLQYNNRLAVDLFRYHPILSVY